MTDDYNSPAIQAVRALLEFGTDWQRVLDVCEFYRRKELRARCLQPRKDAS